MTTAGWIFMGTAWTAIIVVLALCMRLVLGQKQGHGKHKEPPGGPFNM